MNKLAYPKYKELENSWIQQIPEHWNLLPGLAVFDENKIKNADLFENQVLSLSYGKIVIKPKEKLHGLVPESFATYQIVKEGDIIIRPTDLQNDKTSLRVGISRNKGIITSAYIGLKTKPAHHKDFIFRLLQSYDFLKIFYGLGSGLRQNLDFKDLKRLPIMIPPLEEQENICRYLDKAEVQINKFIQKKKRLIELLKEQKQVIINQAVTRGLDSNPRLKPSGIDWLGDIPEHWHTTALKHLAALKSGESITSLSIDEIGNYPVYGGNGIRGYTSSFTHQGFYPLIGRQGALCGNVHLAEGEFWASEHAVVVKPKVNLSINWLTYLLKVMNLNQYSESAAQPGLSVSKIQNLKVPFPSFNEQCEIAYHIEKKITPLESAIAQINKQIYLIQEYRNRLISDVVTGQIDVRNIEITDIVEEERIEDILEEEHEEESLELIGAGDDD